MKIATRRCGGSGRNGWFASVNSPHAAIESQIFAAPSHHLIDSLGSWQKTTAEQTGVLFGSINSKYQNSFLLPFWCLKCCILNAVFATNFCDRE
jgi:hypothetical protein